ncbi:uncharacterized protein LOC130512626 isoform X1 [Raphanus sativus]|uniref:Uncharacterized protein LOC108858768 isoform X1 n=1 Tax=Raphanus sativus TaxID=3726 RepID=A0A9W3CNK6_RAPSA|nr:uncharacterized protein LOC108858768 isoform X1 [Raphanus sativus]XP_056852908.1 uncharacterized protein LOC108858768 isoform X1 [Raphanus sativus]XP_056866778.1 uncharacterized protein LOC130512626 isoform X1 [Raphanus sativus]XP_056866779.1 uncharacterized protein LOC130512626 isoform X1 [Raphanus sativus]
MNLNHLTRTHVASKLQKYRKFWKKVKDESAEKARKAMISNTRSSCYINPQRSYNYKTSLSNKNLCNHQRGYGLGQYNHTMNNNAGFHGSVNFMNRRPTNNSQTVSNFLPRRGSLGVLNGIKEEMGSMSGTSQESQAHKFGQYGTTSGVLGMNSNLSTGTMGSNYAGIRIGEKGDVFGPDGLRVYVKENASLGGMRVTGNDNGSLGGIRLHATSNGSFGGARVQGNSNYGKVHGTSNVSLGGTRVQGNDIGFLNEIRVHGTSSGSLGGTRVQGNDNGFLDEIRVHGNRNGSFGEIRVHGNDSFGGLRVNSTDNGNGSLDRVIVHGNSNVNGSLGGINVHGTGNGSLGGIQVHGNASLGENLSGMNWNFNNNNMMSNHGSSTGRFPSALSSFFDNKDQSHNYLKAQTSGVVPVLENPIISNNYHGINEFYPDTINSEFDHNQQQGKATGENPEVPTAYPLENLSNGNYNEETLNTVAPNSEMYFPTDQNMIITNQEYGVEDLMELPLSFDQDCDDENSLKFLLEDDMN